MTIHVYLHRNGGFPSIHKDCTLKFFRDNGRFVEIINDEEEVIREYSAESIFKIEIMMDEE